MQRARSRLLHIITTAFVDISQSNCRGCRCNASAVLAADKPAAFGCVRRQFTSPAFHVNTVTVISSTDLASHETWCLQSHQRRQKSKKKGGKQTTSSNDATATDVDAEFDISTHEQKMHQSVEHYYHELAGLRTGRASPTLLDGILVDIHGDKMNLPYVATVVMKGTRTLAVTVYDRDNTAAVSTAIRASPLELQVREEGGQLIVPIPEMSPAARTAMAKLAHDHAEQARVAVRQVRHKAMAEVKAVAKQIGEDEKKRREKKVDEVTKRFIADIDAALKKKEKEFVI